MTQSVSKLLSRVVTPDRSDYKEMQQTRKSLHEFLHDYTYGITSDPMVQFCLAFVALVHDMDHPGVNNATLVKERDEMAIAYKNKSVAEQNSVDLAWDLLMETEYVELRKCLYQSQEELERFRNLLVNGVMATDVMDKELAAKRRARWDIAFNSIREESSQASAEEESAQDHRNRKATIVIEHMIQASDVCHTMQ